MASFLLLHGSFHAAWNWHRVVPLLAGAGHDAAAIDLPGHGRDRTPAREVTLDACVRRVVAHLDGATEPVVLVAHSRNGIVISQAAERRPEKVAGLVYLAGYLVPNGKSMMDYAQLDTESLLIQNVDMPLPRRWIAALIGICKLPGVIRLLAAVLPNRWQTHMVRRSAYREALYHDCPSDITELANVLLEPEPHWAGLAPLSLTAGRYGRVPKVYVECLEDRAVTLRLQRRMCAESPCDGVVSLPTGHSPFFARPAELTAALVESLAAFGAC